MKIDKRISSKKVFCMPLPLLSVPVVQPQSVSLGTFSPMRREPVRPVAHRPPDFMAKFDAQTLVFEAVRTGRNEGREVLVLAPPFLNLSPSMAQARWRAQPSGSVVVPDIQVLDRHNRIRLHVAPQTTHLSLQTPFGDTDIIIKNHHHALFAGLRVMMTKSQNNDLVWIRDWVSYHRDMHGAQAVLIYDNASTAYSAQDLADMLADIPGLVAACVVSWPFPFGPQGLGDGRFWESDFCELGLMEHARWCFLQEARSVMNADIDEMVVCAPNTDVFTQAERSLFGVHRYYGRWVYGMEGLSPEPTEKTPVRHKDFTIACRAQMYRKFGLFSMDRAACFAKWTVAPRRCPDAAQWHLHTIKGMMAARLFSNSTHFLHFREISKSWKYYRQDRQVFDPARFERHTAFCAAIEQVQWD